jgi:hypothetical protein
MKSIITIVVTSIVFFVIGWKVSIYFNVDETLPPLAKYTIENLSKTNIIPGKFKLYKSAKESEKFLTKIFHYDFNPDPEKLYIKTTTGQINIPKEEGHFPIIIMLRGYIDQSLYRTGDGTRNSASMFAENGYITIAIDFLGYAESDQESEDIFETRFQTYTTVLSLIKSLDQIEKWNGKIDIDEKYNYYSCYFNSFFRYWLESKYLF